MSIPIVKVKQGRIKGVTTKNVDGGEYLLFPAVPYAEPPLGNLRFKDPRPPQTWNGVRDVAKISPKAAQYDILTGVTTGSEDCLYLTIATNSLIGKRPVMVWIHGGGFVMGSAQSEFYGPDYLLKRDIVFVGITYRLGCLGFLNLNVPDAAGNQGLKDQIAGLKWIKENIRGFGGDPENITLIGESAGAVSVHLVAVSPLGQGLFHKVIAQSGAASNPWASQNDPVDAGLRLAELANKKTNDPNEALQHLMTVPTIELIQCQRNMNDANMDMQLFFHFGPSVDLKSTETFMPESPREMMKRGINVPLLAGFMSDEGIIAMLGANEDIFRDVNEDFARHLGRDMRIRDIARVESIAESVRNFYFDEGTITFERDKNAYAQLKGDVNFVNGVQEIVDIQSTKSTPTYLFRFSYRASYPTIRTLLKCDIEGTCHGDELNALFHGTLFMADKPHQKGTIDRLVMQRMTRMWTNFAKTGNPTPEIDEILPFKWEPIAKDKRNHMEINDELTPGVNPGGASWQLWKPILESLY